MYDHRYRKVLPLSDGAKKNGGSYTVQVSTSGDGSNAGINATLVGDVQFTMTQTPSSFRPMDASDPASNCPALGPGNQASDDCHIFYQLGIVWPSQGEMVPARPPLWSPRAGQHRPPLSSSSGSAALATIAPYSSRRISVPALGVRQGGTQSSTRPRPAATARGRGTVPRDDEYGDLTTTYNLTLSLPTAAPGAPAAAWLPGTSTNYTPPDRDPAEPDYVFDNDTGGLTDSYVDLNGWGYTTVVTSRDFGGVAELRATATVQGMTFDVNVVDSSGNLVKAPTDSPMRLCGTDFAQHPYASLPVDQDCNGIADSWEGQYTNPPGGHLDPNADNEPGYTPTSPKGDGWSVHDEYRGFHYVADDGATVKWTSTDPVSKFDVFFWDTSVVPNRQPRNTIYSFTQALRAILCLQGSADEMAQGAGAANCANGVNEADAQLGIGANPLTYLYRRVNPQQANAATPADATNGVAPFNANSLTAQADSTKYHYVAVYNSVLQPPWLLNLPGDYSIVDIVTGTRSAFSLVLGQTQNLGSCATLGTSACKERIDIDTKAITTFLSDPPLRSFPQPTLLAEVVAHETGHLFGRLHTIRPNCCAYGPAASEFNFTFSNNNKSTSNTIDLLLQQPYRFNRLMVPPENVKSSSGKFSSPTEGGSGKKTLGSGYYPSGTYLYPYQVTNSIAIDQNGSPAVWVQTQLQKLMDWAPYLYLQTPAQWQFSADDLSKLCAKVPCK